MNICKTQLLNKLMENGLNVSKPQLESSYGSEPCVKSL